MLISCLLQIIVHFEQNYPERLKQLFVVKGENADKALCSMILNVQRRLKVRKMLINLNTSTIILAPGLIW